MHILCTVQGIQHANYLPVSGFPCRPENLQNENGHGKGMEHDELAKSHEILSSIMVFYHYWPQILINMCTFFATTKKVSINVESLHFLTFSAKKQ